MYSQFTVKERRKIIKDVAQITQSLAWEFVGCLVNKRQRSIIPFCKLRNTETVEEINVLR